MDNKSTTEQEAPARNMWSTIAWTIGGIVALVVIVVVVLALMGPSAGTVFSNIMPAI